MSAALLTVGDVAERLGVSSRLVHDELRRKHLRGSKLPGKAGWRVTEDDLQRYIDARANLAKVRRSA
jgi:excisionase family DNA binding protein